MCNITTLITIWAFWRKLCWLILNITLENTYFIAVGLQFLQLQCDRSLCCRVNLETGMRCHPFCVITSLYYTAGKSHSNFSHQRFSHQFRPSMKGQKRLVDFKILPHNTFYYIQALITAALWNKTINPTDSPAANKSAGALLLAVCTLHALSSCSRQPASAALWFIEHTGTQRIDRWIGQVSGFWYSY